MNTRTRHIWSLGASGLALAVGLLASGAAQAATVSFEAVVSSAAGDLLGSVSIGDTIRGRFAVDDATSSLMSLTLDISGSPVVTTDLMSSTGDLGSSLSLVAEALASGRQGTLYADWLSGGGAPGGVATSATPSFSFGFRETLSADATGDGVVGSSDFLVLSAGFGGPGPAADFNRDGVVGGPDFVELSRRYGDVAGTFAATSTILAVTSDGGGSAPIPTPEPASAVLFGVGGLVVSRAVRRRRR